MLSFILLIIILVIIIVLAIKYTKSGGDGGDDKFYTSGIYPNQYILQEHDGGDTYKVGIVFTDRVFSFIHDNTIYILSEPTQISVGDRLTVTADYDNHIFNITTPRGEIRNYTNLLYNSLPKITHKINSNMYAIEFINIDGDEDKLYIENCEQVGYLALFEDNEFYYYFEDNDDNGYGAICYSLDKKSLNAFAIGCTKLHLLSTRTTPYISQLELSDHRDNDGKPVMAMLQTSDGPINAIILTYTGNFERSGYFIIAKSAYDCTIIYNNAITIKVTLLPGSSTLCSFESYGARYKSLQRDNMMLLDRASSNIYYNVCMNNGSTVIYEYNEQHGIAVARQCLPGTEGCNVYDYHTGWIDPELAPIQFVNTELETI